MQGPTPEELNEFMSQLIEDLGDDWDSVANQRILAACKDVRSDNYMLLMAVPSSALNDTAGPDLWRTPDKKKFLAAFNEEVLFSKAEEIQEENPNYTDEEKNEAMAGFLASFMPALFERALELPELDI